ncbi:MAG: hypothetical protein ACE5FO_12500 [Parvularculaceae bacterium]
MTRHLTRIAAVFLAVTIFAVSNVHAKDVDYVVLGDGLQKLKDDFNAKAGTVRLLFIVGPTCGICLRGMADLNDAFIADYQNDPRLNTFVVHVPTLGAEEKHVAPAAKLMAGPRIWHFWDPVGTTGRLYSRIFDTETYIWDFWFIYGPDAVWTNETPPAPDFWQHQLGGFPRNKRLNKKTFAAEAVKHIKALSVDETQTAPGAPLENPYAGGAVIPVVGQGYGRAVRQYIESRGGKEAIKNVLRREYRGQLKLGDDSYDLTVVEERPNRIDKRTDDLSYVLTYDGEGQVLRSGGLKGKGLSFAAENHLIRAFDFDGPMVDWSQKGHKFEMQGMEKVGDILAWNLVQAGAEGSKWTYLVNSHDGTIVRMRAFDSKGEPLVTVRYSDYRDVQGALLAHRVEYYDANEELRAAEKFDDIRVGFENAEL